ncbi:MAG: hypothetical protein AB1540_11375 [Bdellovibrionota bacterium]
MPIAVRVYRGLIGFSLFCSMLFSLPSFASEWSGKDFSKLEDLIKFILPPLEFQDPPPVGVPFWFTYTTQDGCGTDRPGIFACDQEEGHWQAVRFTPQFPPFFATAVRYSLGNYETQWPGGNVLTCNGGLEHRVELYVGSSTTPNSNPMPVAAFTIPATQVDPSTQYRAITISLPTPIEVKAGEHIFLSIQQVADIVNGSRFAA